MFMPVPLVVGFADVVDSSSSHLAPFNQVAGYGMNSPLSFVHCVDRLCVSIAAITVLKSTLRQFTLPKALMAACLLAFFG